MDAVNGRPYICIGGVDAKVKIYDVIDGRLVEVRITTVQT
jgi:polycomb protein EED